MNGMTRRELLQALGGGALVAVLAPSASAQRGSGSRGGGNQTPNAISGWLHIGTDGKVTVFSGKVEVGQNVRTSLAQAVAEELKVPFESIEMVLGDTDRCPFDQGTFGSRSTPSMAPQLRQAAASAREALVEIAAKKWNVEASRLRVEDGRVIRASGGSSGNGEETLSFGELAREMPADRPVRRDAELTPASEWKVLGQNLSKPEGRAIVTGAHRYTVDVRRPGMLFAKILRPPSLGAELISADVSAAAGMAGVKVVKEEGFVGTAAPTLRLAEKALATVKAEWREKPQPANKDLWDILRGQSGAWIADADPVIREDQPWLTQEPPQWSWMAGASDEAIAPTEESRLARDMRTGEVVIEAMYRCPYIAHVPLEPRAAFAEYDGNKMTVYTGTQRPFGVRGEVAQAAGLPADRVRVIVPDTGSGYGGKHSGDAAVEAARMAKALQTPISLTWTRWEEFMFAYFRPAGVVEVKASTSGEGKLTAWSHVNFNSGGAGIRCTYDVPNPNTQNRGANTPLRQGSYRTLAATFNNFARESVIDELAHAQHINPLRFRLDNLRDERLANVLKAAADGIGYHEAYGRDAPPGLGRGIACGTEKGGYVATAVVLQANAETGQIRLLRIVTAFECGAVVNPVHCENQVMGSVLQGLGGALFERIEFADGKILNGTMAQYRVPRFSDIPPRVETILLDRKDLPSAGAGEAAIIAIAPAIGNAIYEATRVRLRELPLQFPAK